MTEAMRKAIYQHWKSTRLEADGCMVGECCSCMGHSDPEKCFIDERPDPDGPMSCWTPHPGLVGAWRWKRLGERIDEMVREGEFEYQDDRIMMALGVAMPGHNDEKWHVLNQLERALGLDAWHED